MIGEQFVSSRDLLSFVDGLNIKGLSVQNLELPDTTIQEVIERYLLQTYFSNSRWKIDHTESLLSLGFLDSLAFVQLISFIENEFKIVVDDADVVADNFQSLDAIARLVSRIRENE